MASSRRVGDLIFVWCGLLGALLQTMGLVRYILRQSQDCVSLDWVGLGVYLASILAFVLITLAGLRRAARLP